MKSHYRGHKMAVWLNLIPQLHQPGDQDVSMRHHHFHERANHYYSGAVKAESFTRAPPNIVSTNGQIPECPPNITMLGASDRPPLEVLVDPGGSGEDNSNTDNDDDDEEAILKNQFYTTSTALGVTVGLGCLLLVLNALVFSAIYYQRRKKRKKRKSDETDDVADSCSSNAIGSRIDLSEITTLEPLTPCLKKTPSSTNLDNSKKIPPQPPMRTCSNPSTTNSGGGTIKKRVQIQEISV